MYSASHPTTTSMNGMGGDIIAGSGTINPAALSSAVLPTPPPINAPEASPRGVKRSRSPESYGDTPGDGDDDDSKRRKRGRQLKRASGGGVEESPTLSTSQPPAPAQTSAAAPAQVQQVQTPQLQSQPLPQPPAQVTPTQASPTKATPTKSVVKALPTVRDHTTDQLGPDGDEYIPREYDEAGEKKITNTGHLLDGREFRCRTFFVPGRADKLFMLATECARVLGYRDSYLLFNKNRSLYKIIATQPEKDDLIHQEILPYSYRSRQIAIVTAKSMFRQFGSRVIVGGRRVRDDYWEGKAKKQGFTEEDLAGEKRPGAAKARDAAAAEASANVAALSHSQHQDIVYSNGPGHGHLESHPQPQTVQPGMGTSMVGPTPLPMIHLIADNDTMRFKDYGNVPRPRQEITGAPYIDRSTPSSGTEIQSHAHQTADYNKAVNQQRMNRGKMLDQWWKQPHDVPTTAQPPQRGEPSPAVSQALSSPLTGSSAIMGTGQPPLAQQPHSSTSHMMTPQFSQAQHQQSQMVQSPARSVSQAPLRQDQLHRSPSLTFGPGGAAQPGSMYSFPGGNQMWPPAQPSQSPVSQSHHPLPQYSPHPQQTSPHHQQSPHQPPPPMQQPGAGPQMHGGPLQYQPMPGMGPGGYPTPGGRAYYTPGPNPQQSMYQTSAGPQQGMQGWAPPSQGPPGSSQWGGWSGTG